MQSALNKLPKDSVYTSIDSPVGELWLVASKKGLHAVIWDKENKEKRELKALFKADGKNPVLQKTVKQLREYFSGKRKSFDVQLAPTGTEFQKMAWRELSKIPYGRTISYAEQAKRVGDLKKARAVGTANSKNPISIVVPCHRVIAKNGSLSGFGGGVHVKKYLLDLEQAAVR